MKVKYNLNWQDNYDDLRIELYQISQGEDWCRQHGHSLAFHYKEACKVCWPHIDWHRWTELANAEIRRPNAKLTVLMGAGSTGKTNATGWEYLLEYYASPNDTLVLISSTEIRSLELRVWGEIKSLHEMAKERHPWLPGYLIDSKHCITTDKIAEDDAAERIKARDLRKGVVGVPTVQGGKSVGLGKWCFPSGQLVDTIYGKVPIENVGVGTLIMSCTGMSEVVATSNHIAPKLVRLKTIDGRTVDCTPNHPFLTQLGWVNAIDISKDHYIFSGYETLSLLQKHYAGPQAQVLLQGMPTSIVGKAVSFMRKVICTNRAKSDLLFSALCREMENEATGNCEENIGVKGFRHNRKSNKHGNKVKPKRDVTKKNYGEEISLAKKRCFMAKIQSEHENIFGKNCSGIVPGCYPQLPNRNWKKFKTWISSLLRLGHFLANSKTCGGNRREKSPELPATDERRTEGQVSHGSWVESVAVLKPDGDSRYFIRKNGYRVYDLQIRGHPSFSVNGLIAHNCGIKQKHLRLIADDCTAMNASFLSAFANLNNNIDFQACICFNPDDMLDPGGIAAEPKDGWSGHMEPNKTIVWDTKFYNGRCINFVGTDSPNFDYPQDQKPRYPYLVSQKKINETLSAFPKDSFEYYSQCVGVMKIAQLSRRVITRDLCRQFHAQDEAVWEGEKQTKLAGLDASYGGDRCVGGYAEFGPCEDGKIRLQFYPPHIVPVRVSKSDDPLAEEDQISDYERNYCKTHDVPPGHFYHDSTGRGSLGTSLSRKWSSQCNPVEFGGAPSKRPVTMDTYITDKKTGIRRLKRCDEAYSKFVTELWYSMRFAIEADQIRGLPEDVMNELCMRNWDEVNGKKVVETKEEMKLRTRKSPDLADWACIILEGARRLGFQISKLGNELQSEDEGVNWLEEWQQKHEKWLRSKELAHT